MKEQGKEETSILFRAKPNGKTDYVTKGTVLEQTALLTYAALTEPDVYLLLKFVNHTIDKLKSEEELSDECLTSLFKFKDSFKSLEKDFREAFNEALLSEEYGERDLWDLIIEHLEKKEN